MWKSKKYLQLLLLFGLLLYACTMNLSALKFDGPSVGFPENTEVRREFYSSMTGSNQMARAVLPSWKVIQSTGVRVNFFTEEDPDDLGNNIFFCFSHGPELDFDKGTAGSYIIKRNLDEYDNINHGIEQIKIFYKNDDFSYLRIKEAENKEESLMEIKLYGRTNQKNIKVPNSLAQIAVMSFAELASLTSAYVDWNFYIPDYRKLYGDYVRRLSETIRPLLGFLSETDDGTIDADGNFVYIETLEQQSGRQGLNCSGFAKWVIDGIYKPVKGINIDVGLLKRKHLDLRGNEWSEKLEDKLDPYFGLDWTRNLAFEIMKLYEPSASIDSVDVDNLRYHDYRENVGFPVESLKTVMYELAIKYPDNFYLGSLNSKSDEPPYLRMHTHVVVIFPYIDTKGIFQSVIFSTNEEISLDFLNRNWEGNYIHLVKVEASSRFDPSGIHFNPVIRR